MSNVIDRVNVVDPSGANVVLPDVRDATWNDIRLTAANVSITAPPLIAGASFTVLLRQDNPGGRLVTWDPLIKWSNNVVPILTATTNKADLFAFTCDGTFWIGAFAIPRLF